MTGGFKVGDEVLVRGKVEPASPGFAGVHISVYGMSLGYVRDSDVRPFAPVPVEPQPVDPSTLRVGDRVRAVRTSGRWSQTFEGTVSAHHQGLPLLHGYGLIAGASRSAWFLLDRPEPVDPRREAVRDVLVEAFGEFGVTTTATTRFADAILAAIDGAVSE